MKPANWTLQNSQTVGLNQSWIQPTTKKKNPLMLRPKNSTCSTFADCAGMKSISSNSYVLQAIIVIGFDLSD